MFIDCSKLPDPTNPQHDDVYTSPGHAVPGHTIVVTRASYWSDDGGVDHMRLVRDGTSICIPTSDFMPLLVSLGVRPWGRLDRSSADGRPKISDDPQLVAQRLEGFGPHLRALREQYGLSMGDLARALGCPPARLSMLELGEPDPVREGAGMPEAEGRAALAELLTEAVAQTFKRLRGEGLEPVRPDVWDALFGMLATAPAMASMEKIVRASLKSNAGASARTGSRPARALTQATQRTAGGFTLYVYEPSTAQHPCSFKRGDEWWTWTDSEAFARAAAAIRWPGVNVTWAGFDQSWALRTVDDTALLVADATTRGELIIEVPPAPASNSNSVFRPGDRITYKGKAATVREVDHEDFAMLVTFESGETSAVPMTEVRLANENVAIETVLTGLAWHIGAALEQATPSLDSKAEDYAAIVAVALATDEAQRLIRLHG